MTKFKMIGAACLAVSLVAASPSFAAGYHSRHHAGRAHFAHGYRGGIGPGIAIGSAFRGAYGYYGASHHGDSYGYSGREVYDRSTNENGNSN
jgi:hypothetical protein